MGASPACAGLDWRGMCGTAVAVCSEFACVGGCVGRLAGSSFKGALQTLSILRTPSFQPFSRAPGGGWGSIPPKSGVCFPPILSIVVYFPLFDLYCDTILLHFVCPLYRACISCISQVLKTCVDLGPRYTYSTHDSNRLYRYFTIHANTCTPIWTRSRHARYMTIPGRYLVFFCGRYRSFFACIWKASSIRTDT